MHEPPLRNLYPAWGVHPDIAWFAQSTHDASIEQFREQPPEHLKHVHDPLYLSYIWSRLLDQVRQPARLQVTVQGTRWIELVSASVLAQDASGAISLWEWQARGQVGDLYLRKVPDHLSVIEGFPVRDDWLIAASRLASLEICSRFNHLTGLSRQECEGYANWAFELFRRLTRQHCDLQVMRRRVARVIALDPMTQTIAARLIRRTDRRWPPTISEYNQVIRHRTAFHELWRDAPYLVTLYGVYCDQWDFPKLGRPQDSLYAYLRERGMPEVGWRHLQRHGGRSLQPLRTGSIENLQSACMVLLQNLGTAKGDGNHEPT